MTSATPSRRAESRIPMRMFVKLSDPESGKFEITTTVDISVHGARVVSKSFWQHNQQLLVRSICGNLYSYARVAHCQFVANDSYMVGLELYRSTGDWTTSSKSLHQQ